MLTSYSATAVPDPLYVETVVLDGMWRVPDDAEHGDRYRIAWFDPPFWPPMAHGWWWTSRF